MSTATQEYRQHEVTSPLGADVLLFRRMRGKERLGQLFEYNLEVYSQDHAINYADILGQNVTVRLWLPMQEEDRFFNGFVSEFSQGISHQERYSSYQITLRPWLWFLTRTNDCRIFQLQTVPDIVKSVFRDNGFSDFEDRLTGDYREREYCVQYRESDFDFVCRLLEEEGAYFYFLHERGKHKLVLSDEYSAHDSLGDIPYYPEANPELRDEECIFDWQIRQRLQPGRYVLNDFDFKVPKKALLTPGAVVREHAMAEYEVYDYPGEFTEPADGEHYSRMRIEELQAQHELLAGTADDRRLYAGVLFNLTKHPRDDRNREYLITEINYQLTSNEYETDSDQGDEPAYRCQLVFMDAAQAFRPERVTTKPVMRGPQTAIVVGPVGEEIYTDEHGRVKCQFHWDRYGEFNENSSCWIRVSHPWAGKDWGAISIPRIGQEVIVDFLEGDPDQPIITGRVYNGDQMPPYGLPDGKVVSGIKSNSTKGGGGYNEIAMDDTKSKELVRIHAQYDMDTTVEHDQRNTILNDQTDTIKNDRTTTINKGNDKLTVEAGKRAVTVKSDSTHTVQAGNRTVQVTGGDYFATSTDKWVKHKGVAGVAIHGQGEGVGVLGEPMVSIEGKSQVDVQAKDGVSIKAALVDISDKEIQIHGTQITLQCGGSTIQMDGSKIAISSGSGQLILDAVGATLKGALVKIN